MLENIDLPRFLESVESEIGLLTIPRTYVEGQLQDQFNDQHRIVDEPASSGTLPSGVEQEQRQLSEQEWHEKLQGKWYNNYSLMIRQLLELEPHNKEWQAAQAQFAEDGKITPVKFSYLWEQRQKISEQKARQLLAHKEVCTSLCQALQTTPNDSFEIAKIITPRLLGLAAGEVSLPIIPVLFASTALAIARMGIAGLCVDKQKDDDKNSRKLPE
jgi:hypothetical protein